MKIKLKIKMEKFERKFFFKAFTELLRNRARRKNNIKSSGSSCKRESLGGFSCLDASQSLLHLTQKRQ